MNRPLSAPTFAEDYDADQRWQSFVRRVEDMLGRHLDGDQATGHYSLDHAYDAFREGQSVVEYALGVQAAEGDAR